MSDDEVKGRNDFPLLPPSLPPENKVTLQVALSILLALLMLIGLVGAILGAVDKPTLSMILASSIGGVLALMTGGSRTGR